MPKLHQHQLTGHYFTRIAFRDPDGVSGHIITKQIHPDGVRWLKAQGTRLGGELVPEGAEHYLAKQGWLFTLEEVPEWGTIDWAPDWRTIGSPAVNPYKAAAMRARALNRQRKVHERASATHDTGGRPMSTSPGHLPANMSGRASPDQADPDRIADRRSLSVTPVDNRSSRFRSGLANLRSGDTAGSTAHVPTNAYYAEMLRQLHTGGPFLERCAESMYRLREPRNSQTITYTTVSPNKKERNREIAREVMGVAIRRVQYITSFDEIEGVFDSVAREFYSHVAPLKSQTEPLDQRSAFAQDWYRQRARDFLYSALYPDSATESSGQFGNPRSVTGVAGIPNTDTSTPAHLPDSPGGTLGVEQTVTPSLPLSRPHRGEGAATQSGLGQPPATASPPEPSTTSPGRPAPAVNTLILGAIVVLLVVLILLQLF